MWQQSSVEAASLAALEGEALRQGEVPLGSKTCIHISHIERINHLTHTILIFIRKILLINTVPEANSR